MRGRVGDGEPGLTGYRGTWGLPRLVFPAVVAYVVRMYRVRARLFATVTGTSTAHMTRNDLERRQSMGISHERYNIFL